MKKLTVMLLIAAMVLGVSACGNSANKGNTATESQMSTQEAECWEFWIRQRCRLM